MAGGKGTRLGELGRTAPKCLLPLPDGTTLLARLTNQLRGAGIDQIVVCCSPENHSQIKPPLDDYRATTGIPQTELKAVSCESCRLGPVPALAEAVSKVSARWYLLCLADIYFTETPFGGPAQRLADNPSLDGCLLTGVDQMTPDGSGSGYVASERGTIRAISYRPFGPEQTGTRQVHRWTGSFLFRSALISDLQANPAAYGGKPFEDWIMHLLAGGARCSFLDAGPFVNVNSAHDYQFLKQTQITEKLV